MYCNFPPGGDAAENSWPPELRADGQFIATADKGVLWFDTTAELIQLRDRANTLLE